MKRKGIEEGPPPCVDEKCREPDGKHYISYCPNSSEALKTTLRDNYIVRGKARNDKGESNVSGKINKATSTKGDASGSDGALFDVTFLKEKITANLLADQGADANLIPLMLFKEAMAQATDSKVILLDPRTHTPGYLEARAYTVEKG